MTLHAARMRRWMLWAAPIMILGGLRWHAGGAGAGLALWLALGAALRRPGAYPYPRKRRTPAPRLFWGGALAAALLAAALRLLPQGALTLLGAAGFSLSLGAWASALPLPRSAALAGGALFCALYCLLLWV